MSGAARPDQRGAATVLAVAMAGVLLLVGAAAGVVGAVVVAHRTAQAAADLAALAGAVAVARAAGDPCAEAAAIADGNGAGLESCAVTGRTVEVEVVVPGPRWLGQDRDLTARARAGPGGPAKARGVSSPRARRGPRDAAPARPRRACRTAR